MVNKWKLGYLVFSLSALVACGGGSSSSEKSSGGNLSQTPQSIIEADSEVYVGTLIELSGVNSIDPKGEGLSYGWKFESEPEDAASSIVNSESVLAQFTPDVMGDYVVSLEVVDSLGSVDVSSKSIRVTDDFSPRAAISVTGKFSLGDPLRLDGSESIDEEGVVTAYLWEIAEQPIGSDAEILDADQAIAQFTPETKGRYQIKLTVTDTAGQADSILSTFNIDENQAPVVEVAGYESEISENQILHLDASLSSDDQVTSLTYHWEILQKPSLSEITIPAEEVSAEVYRFAPDYGGLYRVQITVSDGRKSTSKILEITVLSDVNITITGKLVLAQTSSEGEAQSDVLLRLGSQQQASTGDDGRFKLETTWAADNLDDLVLKAYGKTGDSIFDYQLLGIYNIQDLTQNSADVDIGTNSIPVLRDFEWYFFPCSNYSGPDEFSVTLKKAAATETDSIYKTDFTPDSQISFTATAGETYAMKLAVPTGYTLSSSQVRLDSGESFSGNIAYYDASISNMVVVNTCHL